MQRIAAAWTIVLLACSSSPPAPSIKFEDLDQETQQASCERLVRCHVFPDDGSCQLFTRVVANGSLAAAVAAHKVNFDGTSAKQCMDALSQQSCDLGAHDSRVQATACANMLVGTLAGGAACSFDTECASGTCELPNTCTTGSCCVGMCRPTQPPGKPGDACAKTRDCAAGTVCGDDMMCHVLAAAGGNCQSDQECGDDLACIDPRPSMPGTCQPLAKLGDPCPYQRCGDVGARCDTAGTHTCIAVGLPGDPCPTGIECSFGAQCNMTTHLCEPYPALGMPCTTSCVVGAFCAQSGAQAGTCVPANVDGAACDSDDQCTSFFCQEGVAFDQCQEPLVCI